MDERKGDHVKKSIMILVFCLILLCGCSNTDEDRDSPANTNNSGTTEVTVSDPKQEDAQFQTADSEVVEIKEKMFVTQANDVYINTEDYLGKTIQLEGMFDQYTDETTGKIYYSVFRYGPGCCGYDANAGFEVIWDGEYPNVNDWVQAVGILEIYEEAGSKFLRLKLSQLNVLGVRGEENVTQ